MTAYSILTRLCITYSDLIHSFILWARGKSFLLWSSNLIILKRKQYFTRLSNYIHPTNSSFNLDSIYFLSHTSLHFVIMILPTQQQLVCNSEYMYKFKNFLMPINFQYWTILDKNKPTTMVNYLKIFYNLLSVAASS